MIRARSPLVWWRAPRRANQARRNSRLHSWAPGGLRHGASERSGRAANSCSSSGAKRSGDAVDKSDRDRFLGLHRPRFNARSGNEMHLVVGAAKHAGFGRHVVCHDPVAALTLEFFARVLEESLRFSRKADHKARALLMVRQR